MTTTTHTRMRDKLILKVVGRLFIPFILLFAFYVQFHGDFGPGGGFQAGVIFAAAFVLYGLIFGLDDAQKVVPPMITELCMAFGLILYVGTGFFCRFFGRNFLDYDALSPAHPMHGQHWGILLVEAGVGITVASTILMIYYMFARRGIQS
ncbi:MAG: Na(+)/H(+) antiporter subunit B [Bradymonadia bacterium]